MISRLIYYILNEYRLYICDLYSDSELDAGLEQRPWVHYKQTRTQLLKIFGKSRWLSCPRAPIVSTLVQSKEFSKGKQLAEEFEDYRAMIEICDELKDVEQLRVYIEEYKEKVKRSSESLMINRRRIALVSRGLRRVSSSDVSAVSSFSKGVLRFNLGSAIFKIQTRIRLDGGHQESQLRECQ